MAQLEIPIRFRFIRIPVVWEALSNERLGGEPEKWDSPDKVRLSQLDAWQCREEFFRLREGDIAGLAKFLNKVGVWSSDPEHATLDWSRYPLGVNVEDVWSFRESLRDGLSSSYRKNFTAQITPVTPRTDTLLDLMTQPRNSFPLRLELTRVAAGVVTFTNARHMLLATVLADIARGIRFKACRREDCGALFPIENEHKRIFCTQYCGHLVSLRRKRAKEKARKQAEQRRAAKSRA